MNAGKQFEQDFKNSIPTNTYYYRLRDGTAGWGEQEKTRFQAKNICDAILYRYPHMHLLELKSTKGKSIPLSRLTQYKDMVKAQSKGLFVGFIFNMRDVNETYYVLIDDITHFMQSESRKSLPIDFMREHGIIIGQELKRTRWRYNVAEWLDRLENKRCTNQAK